jgi:hypothetical protein
VHLDGKDAVISRYLLDLQSYEADSDSQRRKCRVDYSAIIQQILPISYRATSFLKREIRNQYTVFGWG